MDTATGRTAGQQVHPTQAHRAQHYLTSTNRVRVGASRRRWPRHGQRHDQVACWLSKCTATMASEAVRERHHIACEAVSLYRGRRMEAMRQHLQGLGDGRPRGGQGGLLACMPSRAKLMPSAGSGTSGGTSSAGRSTSQEPSLWPYRQRFSRSGSLSWNSRSTLRGQGQGE